ncbi:MAG: OmpA family protein [Deferrisomatales bacterium]|nr:OmpA family protein [Deferrisomatales bacterium]
MRWWGVTAVVLMLPLAGCGGAAKQQLQEQSVRLQAAEARVAELEGQLGTQRGESASTSAELEICRAAVRRADDALQQLRRAGDGLETRLGECVRREEAVRADLDLSRRGATAGEEKLARALAGFEAERQGWTTRQAELQRGLEAARSEAVTLQAEIHVLLEEKARVEREKREKLEEIAQTYEGLLKGMREQVAQGRVTISNLRGQLSVKLQEEILFDSGSAVVKPEGQQLLTEIAAVLQEIGDRGTLVEGHTDDVPIRGVLAQRFSTNWELSAARALSVVRFLQEVGGVDPARLAAAGYGEYRPAVPNDSAENRARNRRIELKLVPLPQAEPPEEADATDTGTGTGSPGQEQPAAVRSPGEPGAGGAAGEYAPVEAGSDTGAQDPGTPGQQ